MDLGCGEGRYLNHLQESFPEFDFRGVDPLVSDEARGIQTGSAFHIPFADKTFDAVYAFIVFQHIHDPVLALSEIHRVLKLGGLLIVGDRDVISARGLLKPYHELRGRWMYPWDSPFRERWYTTGTWRKLLANGGFQFADCERLTNPEERGWRRLARKNAFWLISATAAEKPIASKHLSSKLDYEMSGGRS
jgi:SAM-dependent methyltransferase